MYLSFQMLTIKVRIKLFDILVQLIKGLDAIGHQGILTYFLRSNDVMLDFPFPYDYSTNH